MEYIPLIILFVVGILIFLIKYKQGHMKKTSKQWLAFFVYIVGALVLLVGFDKIKDWKFLFLLFLILPAFYFFGVSLFRPGGYFSREHGKK